MRFSGFSAPSPQAAVLPKLQQKAGAPIRGGSCFFMLLSKKSRYVIAFLLLYRKIRALLLAVHQLIENGWVLTV